MRSDIGDDVALANVHAIERQGDAVDMEMAALDFSAELVGAAEKFGHESGLRRRIDLLRRARLLDAAAVQHRDLIGEVERLFLIVGDENGGQFQPLVQAAQPAAQILAHLRVERAEGLVEQKQFRFDGERARKRTRWRCPPESWAG